MSGVGIDGMSAEDTDFAHAVRRAGRAMAAKGESYEVAGAALAAYLRSDRPLGPLEREYLAQLVLGDLVRPRGARPKTASNPDVAGSVAESRAKEGKSKKAAHLEIAFPGKAKEPVKGKSRRTLERNEGKVAERERAVAAGRKPPP